MNRDGKYYNGLSPVSVPITCLVTETELVITNHLTEEVVAIWKKEDIFQDVNHNTAMVLGHRLDKAKIELTDLEISKQLKINSQSLVKKDLHLVLKWLVSLIIIIAFVWFSIPFVVKVFAKNIPYKFETMFASKIQIDSHFKACPLKPNEEKALKAYVNYLYPKNALEKEMPVTFSVSKSEMVNALTFPAGRIILLRGLLKEMKTPEELLGVMAHELGHVVERDSASFLVRGAILTAFFGFITNDFNGTAAVSPQLLLSTAALTFDRDMEKAADAFAAKRLTELHVSTSGLRSFFSRRNHDSDFLVPEFITTHPNFESRIVLIEETYPKEDLPKEITDNWEIIRKICD